MKDPEVLFHDEHIVVANKPADLLSVPGRGPDNQDCLVSRLQPDFPTLRIVHRLDCATSGVMVLALTAEAHRELSRQFHDRETDKRYLANIIGQPSASSGEVNLPLRCDWENRPRQMVDPVQGKSAKTLWQVEETYGEYSLVALTPITGRSHQLRVHMQQLGHPILGDRFYATEEALRMADRLHLHAQTLGFFHPETKQKLTFSSPCPFAKSDF